MDEFNDKFSDINKLLDLPNQNWLFGAGISKNANIPLMKQLTELVEYNIEHEQEKKLNDMYKGIKKLFEQKSNMHIEHILSHIGDLIALIERTENERLKINNTNYDKSDLHNLYYKIVEQITEIVRYGCKDTNDDCIRGQIDNPLVEIYEHREFIKALFSRLENFEGRSNTNFFTTNYDTLLEDALILEKRKVVDGFEGGAMGFWNPQLLTEKENNRSLICKLHGSIDWYKSKEEGLVRARYGTTYVKEKESTMIYPQATKYVETQKDPFAFLFEKFRNTLNHSKNAILCVCGYSFGDNHINNEIENALHYPGNQLTLLIFLETITEEHNAISGLMENSKTSDRVYVMTREGIWYENIFYSKKSQEDEDDLSWWTFSGLTELLLRGEEYNVQWN